MTLREPYERFDAWVREHTVAEFLLYFLVTGLTFGATQLLLSNRPFPFSIASGVVFGLVVTTMMTFVDVP